MPRYSLVMSGALGPYLRQLRTRLDPASLGIVARRRRTPGLRREEVAQRAGMSATWYSWLEQGRGGAPSAEALDRLSRALLLTDAEREHLFLLGLGRPPPVRFHPPTGVPPHLQRLLDALDASPALVRTATWDVVAWNRAAAAVLTDYGARPAAERNLLRLLFLDAETRAANLDWEVVAPIVVGVFRSKTARNGVAKFVQPLVDELCAKSPDFATMWLETDVRLACDRVKRLRHPVLGDIALEFSALTVDGRPDLALQVYTPTSERDAKRIRGLARRH